MESNYIQLSSKIFKDWFDGEFAGDEFLNENFQMGYAPEPYYTLKEGNNPLHILQYNPGGGMEFQLRSNLGSADYSSFQSILSTIYLSEGFRDLDKAYQAYSNNKKVIGFANYFDYRGVVQHAHVPFHGDMDKSKALKVISSSDIIQTYQSALQDYLRDKPTLVISACSNKDSISKEVIRSNEWLMLRLSVANMNLDELNFQPLTIKDGKVTTAIFYKNDKYFLVIQGSLSVPNISYDDIAWNNQ